MTTNINIIVGDTNLLSQAQLQQRAGRQGQVEKESNKRLESQAIEARTKKLAAQGKDAGDSSNTLTGPRFGIPGIERDPVAGPGGPRGRFGFIDANQAYLDSGEVEGVFSAENKIDLTRPIQFNRGKNKKYGVIRVVVAKPADGCTLENQGTFRPLTEFFAKREAELKTFIQKGGVLWVNNEYKNCGIPAGVFNSYLSSKFGSTIGFADNLIDDTDARLPIPCISNYEVATAPLVYNKMIDDAPSVYYTALYCSIINGTPFYSNVCSFQKIGKGFLVLSGDGNGTSAYPTCPYPSTPTYRAPTFIDALRNLR
jgi:hypothetical protein